MLALIPSPCIDIKLGTGKVTLWRFINWYLLIYCRATVFLVFVFRLALKHNRQRTYKRNVQALSRKHSRRGKAVSIAYSECVSVA